MTPHPPMVAPWLDPTPLFELYRGHLATSLLTAAVAHFKVFDRLEKAPMTPDEFRREFGLSERPAVVLSTALRAMGLVSVDTDGRLGLTDVAADHLTTGSHFDVSGYFGLSADSPDVLGMVRSLRTNRPIGADDDRGAEFIFREGISSAMEQEASARALTLALAGRANNVAPVLAKNFPLDDGLTLLDVGGGTGIYSIAWLLRHPGLKAIVWDRPEVLKVASEIAERHGVSDRLVLEPGDMFRDPVPAGCDVILLSNVLHDWDVPECKVLIERLASSLGAGGRLLIHDVFLDDELDGPLPIALYSADLFQRTEGRAYSAGEYREWLGGAGLVAGDAIPTLIHCGVLAAVKV